MKASSINLFQAPYCYIVYVYMYMSVNKSLNTPDTVEQIGKQSKLLTKHCANFILMHLTNQQMGANYKLFGGFPLSHNASRP